MATSPVGRLSAFLAELKRRKVYRVTVIYLVLAVGGLEVASVLLPSTTLPGWFDELFLGLAIVGLPLVIVLSWTFDITETGIQRTPEIDVPDPAQGSVESANVADAPRGSPTAPVDRPVLDPLTVAVLPFENLSGSPEAEPFALGLHDDLLTELSRASALTVISRTSVRGYAGTDRPLPAIARELGAGTIVEGGVQRAGSRVRLNVQVIDAATDRHLWAERFDRELTTRNIFELQTELAGHVMAQLHATLAVGEVSAAPSVPTADLEAYQLLMTGRELLIDRSEAGFTQAEALFQQAVDLDPHYALAWAGLADALIGLVDYGHSDSRKLLERGAAACRRALELDPNLAEGHAAWGRYRTAVRDAPGSVRAHARGIELQPSYAGAWQWSCWASLLMGNGREAVAFGEKAVRLDPFDPEASGNLAMAHLVVGDAQAALEEVDRILRRHPRFEYALWVRGVALQTLGRWGEAADVFGRLTDRWATGWPELGRAAALAAEGDTDGARSLASLLVERIQGFERGMIHAILGEYDQALALMRHEWPLPWAETLYLYAFPAEIAPGFGDDPRFGTLVEEVRRSWDLSSV